jgi:predicted phosphodiesterase
MKIAFLSDIHANLEALNAVLDYTRKEGVDRYACLGDIVGYNPNPSECIKIVRELEPLCIVKGNHDAYAATDTPLNSFNPIAAAAIEWTRKNISEEERKWLNDLPLTANVYTQSVPAARFTAVHASLDEPENWGYIFDRYSAAACLQYQWQPLCFVGHTHAPIAFIRGLTEINGGSYTTIKLDEDKKYLINVGSVGQPRDRDPRAAVVIFDVDANEVTLHRVQYDIAETQRKINAVGLPKRCADRLSFGQ